MNENAVFTTLLELAARGHRQALAERDEALGRLEAELGALRETLKRKDEELAALRTSLLHLQGNVEGCREVAPPDGIEIGPS